MTTGRDPREFDPNYDPNEKAAAPPDELLRRQGAKPRRVRSWWVKLIPLAVIALGIALYLIIGG